MYHTLYLCNLIWPYYSFKLGKVVRWSESILASCNLQLAFKIVWVQLIIGCSESATKTNGQDRQNERSEVKRGETETET